MSSLVEEHCRSGVDTDVDVCELKANRVFLSLTRGFRVVRGLKRLLKLSAKMTAWRTSSSPSMSFSFVELDGFDDIRQKHN